MKSTGNLRLKCTVNYLLGIPLCCNVSGCVIQDAYLGSTLDSGVVKTSPNSKAVTVMKNKVYY